MCQCSLCAEWGRKRSSDDTITLAHLHPDVLFGV